jgi:hypothetical protein
LFLQSGSVPLWPLPEILPPCLCPLGPSSSSLARHHNLWGPAHCSSGCHHRENGAQALPDPPTHSAAGWTIATKTETWGRRVVLTVCPDTGLHFPRAEWEHRWPSSNKAGQGAGLTERPLPSLPSGAAGPMWQWLSPLLAFLPVSLSSRLPGPASLQLLGETGAGRDREGRAVSMRPSPPLPKITPVCICRSHMGHV